MEDKQIENIRVAVRCRPMSKKEINEQAESCFRCEEGTAVLTNPDHPEDVHKFGYDFVYDSNTAQNLVFENIGKPILDRAFGGYNGTVFAYGQTGSGKTFSMLGVSDNDELEGLIPRINKAIFHRVEEEREANPNKQFLVQCSFFEIYNEIIYDLLDSSSKSSKKQKGLEIKEHAILGIYVKGLQEQVVESREQVVDLMAQGQLARTVGSTKMNAESSRSHSIFVIKIHQKDSEDETKNVFAKVNLVDLAGSERAASTGAVGSRLKEGANINKSLSALGNVINALVEVSRTGKKHFIPYRNSKLTRVLQESLGGNSLCSMLATLSPANINFIETLSTLKYASRAKAIKVNAKKNEESSQISKLNEEIAALKKKLQEQASTSDELDPQTKSKAIQQYEKQIQEMDAIRMQTWEDKVKETKKHEIERKRLAKEKEAADRRIKEEKQKTWKLLKEKGDIESAIKATRDLKLGTDEWTSLAAKIKRLEQDRKEHSTMIFVFKDAFDDDISKWMKDSETCEGISSDHMSITQYCSKLKSIRDESKKMLDVEMKCMQHLHQLQLKIESGFLQQKDDHRALPKSAARNEKQLFEDQLQALRTTNDIVLSYRQNLLQRIEADHHKIYEVSVAAGHLESQMERIQAQPSCSETLKSQVETSKEEMKDSLAICKQKIKSFKNVRESSKAYKATEKPMPLRIGRQECETALTLSASSNTCEVRGITLDEESASWTAHPKDFEPYLQLRFSEVHMVSAILLQGGSLNEPSGDDEGVPTVSFTLDKVNESVLKYPVESVNGTVEQAYDILGCLFSWEKLLKTTKIPTKLLSRPPVRFLHDVISLIIQNTKYAQGLYTVAEMDYSQLSGKQERTVYLNKIIELVNSSLGDGFKCDVNTTDILAGQEVGKTLSFLGYLGISALKKVQDSLEKHQQASASSDNAQSIETDTCEKKGWVSKLVLQASLDGEKWISTGELDGCADYSSAVEVPFSVPSAKSSSEEEKKESEEVDKKILPIIPLRYLRIIPKCWEGGIAIRLDIKAASSKKQNVYLNVLANYAEKYQQLLQRLMAASELVLTDAKAKWQEEQNIQREKQAELESAMQQIAVWKKQIEHLQSELKESQTESKELKDQRDSIQGKLEKATAQSASALEEAKQLRAENEGKCKEAEKCIIQEESLRAQVKDSEQEARALQSQVENLTKIKLDLEAVNSKLTSQVVTFTQGESEVEGRMGELENLLQQTKAQLESAKQHGESTEKLHKAVETKLRGTEEELSRSLKEKEEMSVALKELEGSLAQGQTELVQKFEEEKRESERRAQEAENQLKKISEQLEKEKEGRETTEQQLKSTKSRFSVLEMEKQSLLKEQERAIALENRELHLQAANEQLENKLSGLDENITELEKQLAEQAVVVEQLQAEKERFEELEDDLGNQIQVLTEERDASRQKEEQLFLECAEKDEEIERIRDGYVWVTDRMNEKEDELSEMQEQLERYESLMQTTNQMLKDSSVKQPTKAPEEPESNKMMRNLFEMVSQVVGSEPGKHPAEMYKVIFEWIQERKLSEAREAVMGTKVPSQTPCISTPNTTTMDAVKKNEAVPRSDSTRSRRKSKAERTAEENYDSEDFDDDYEGDFEEDQDGEETCENNAVPANASKIEDEKESITPTEPLKGNEDPEVPPFRPSSMGGSAKRILRSEVSSAGSSPREKGLENPLRTKVPPQVGLNSGLKTPRSGTSTPRSLELREAVIANDSGEKEAEEDGIYEF